MGQASPKANDFREEFLLREHESVQEKMSRSASDLSRIEGIVPLSIAVLYAWLAKDGGRVGHLYLWILWLPVALVIFGILRQELRYKYIDAIESYMKKMERGVYGDSYFVDGWENHWSSHGSRGNRHARRAMWIILLVLTGLIAWDGRLLTPPDAPAPGTMGTPAATRTPPAGN